MINEKMTQRGQSSSVIRELFEFGKQRKAIVGEDKVFDFSIGNPSVPCPKEITECMTRLLTEEDPVALHGYTSAAGDQGTRKAIADYINDSRSRCFFDYISQICDSGRRRGNSIYSVFS